MGAERPGASGDVEERATRERGPGHRRAGGCTGRGGSAERSWVERRQVGRGDGAPRRPGRESQGPPGTWAGSGLSGNGGREGRCDGSKKEYTSERHRTRRARRGAGKGEAAHGGKKTQGKNAGGGVAGRGPRAASLTVQVLFLGPHDLVGRGLAYCLGDGGAGDTVLGGGDSVRQALAGHLCGSSATPPARQPAGTGTPKRRRTPTPHRTPYPHRLLLRLPAWGGAQGRALPPSPEGTGSCHPRGQARCRALPCPRLSSAHPFPGQLEPGRAGGTGSCRKMAAPGSSSELSGLSRVT